MAWASDPHLGLENNRRNDFLMAAVCSDSKGFNASNGERLLSGPPDACEGRIWARNHRSVGPNVRLPIHEGSLRSNVAQRSRRRRTRLSSCEAAHANILASGVIDGEMHEVLAEGVHQNPGKGKAWWKELVSPLVARCVLGDGQLSGIEAVRPANARSSSVRTADFALTFFRTSSCSVLALVSETLAVRSSPSRSMMPRTTALFAPPWEPGVFLLACLFFSLPSTNVVSASTLPDSGAANDCVRAAWRRRCSMYQADFCVIFRSLARVVLAMTFEWLLINQWPETTCAAEALCPEKSCRL